MQADDNSKSGLTLVELIVVLLVLGILMAWIGKAYFSISDKALHKASTAAVSEGVGRFYKAYAQHQLDNFGEHPAHDADGFLSIMGYAPETDVDIGDYVLRYRLGTGDSADQVEIGAYRNDGAGSAVGGVLSAANATWPE